MSAPLGTAVRDAAREQLRRELAVRLTAAHDAVLRRVPDLYRRIVGEALLVEDGQTGKAAQLRTAQRALDRIARIGVVDFVDQAGRRWNMQSYVEMAVRTAALRSMVDAQMRTYRERGIEYVYVTNVAGQCELCRPWEGQVLAIDPSPEPRVTTSAASDGSTMQHQVTATVADAIAAGLMHPNCRHRVVRLEPGRTVIPPATPDPEAYADQQRLRALERAVRHWRRREAAAITPEARETARRKVADWQGAIRAHVAATGVQRVLGREQIRRALESPTPRPRPAAAEPQPREDETPTPADGLIADYRNALPALPDNERRALHNYTGGEYVGINSYLRHGSTWATDWAAEPAAAMRRLAERYETPADITVRRYVNADAIPTGVQPDAVFTERGFSSTTLNVTAPAQFRNYPVVLEIDVPAGSHGIVVNAHRRGIDEENEFILPPGRYRVLSDEIGEDGKRHLRVTALPADPDAAPPEPVKAPQARRPRSMSGAELEREMQAAIEREDFDQFDLLAAESDRRDARRVATRERRAQRVEKREAQRAADMERLLNAGVPEEEAVADVYGISVERQRRQAAINRLRAEGYRGRGFDELSRASFKDHAYSRFQDAEDATNGYMVNPEGQRAGIAPAVFFTGPESTVRKYASPEMLEWFDRYGRPTLAEWRAELLGDGQAANRLRNERGDLLT